METGLGELNIKHIVKKTKEKNLTLFDILKNDLEKQLVLLQKKVHRKHKEFLKWLDRQNLSWDFIKKELLKIFVIFGLISSLFLTPFSMANSQVSPRAPPKNIKLVQQEKTEEFKTLLKNINEENFNDNESNFTRLFYSLTGIKTTSVLDEQKLNTNIGLMGAEQHLIRFPGDNLQSHLQKDDEWKMFSGSGMAPHRRAWGFYASSSQDMTPEIIKKEKYYVAVQTFLAPGWDENYKKIYEWFKDRKVIVMNPRNGKAVIAVVGDAGPATWTGKVFGGSPEVMHDLGLGEGSRKGQIIILFIDDPQNSVPLGPVKWQEENMENLA